MKNRITLFSLFIGQGLTGSVISMLTLTSTLAGNKLAPYPFLSTVPVTSTVLGGAIMVYYASYLMSSYGRRTAFAIGSIIGLFGSVLAAVSMYYEIFSLFILSTLILGGATVFNQYYRFAAAEIFNEDVKKKICTSIIIGGGVIGGVAGPIIATKGELLISEHVFLGTFILSSLVFALSFISQMFIFIPLGSKKDNDTQNVKVMDVIQCPGFLIGTMSCALAFSVMTLVMNATPLAMHHEQFNIEQSANVLQWHFFWMYAPAFLLPFLIHKIKTASIIQIGSLLFIIGSAFPLFVNDHLGYIISLSIVGAGWGVMFAGGTFLVNQIVDTKMKYKAQGVNSLSIYVVNFLSSLSVGFFMNMKNGWIIINLCSVGIMMTFLIYLTYRQSRT
ncbi:MFS transporter [Pectobacterium sp. A5351]|uniref:MFS transporter n=1 Tax=Pectobacterium sp. A5351 TaxID=2914983 RepID=UPI00232DD032|nr:MFS transporter [Pectobacterium sp. A5351]